MQFFGFRRMQRLEFKLTVPGIPLMDEGAKKHLLSEDALSPLAHSLRALIAGQAVPEGLFAAQVEQAGVFISDDWVVSVHARRIIQCVSAMAILLSSIGHHVSGSVEVQILTSQGKDEEILELSLQRDQRRGRIIGFMKWAGTILASAALGAFVQWLACGRPLP